MTDLEDRLTALFERRAGDIRTAPASTFTLDDPPRLSRTPAALLVAASAAAVVIAAGATVVGIRSVRHPAPRPNHPAATRPPSAPTSTACPVNIETALFAKAIRSGTAIKLDHPNDTVVSVAGASGEYLLLQSTPNTTGTAPSFEQWTLAIFRGSAGRDVVSSPTGTLESPAVDPSGAVSTGWITWGLSLPQQNTGYLKVQLYDRRASAVRTIDEVSEGRYAAGTQFLGAPVLYAGSLFWLQGEYGKPERTILKSYDPRTGDRTSSPAPGAVSLFFHGDGLALVVRSDDSAAVVNRLGATLPDWLLAGMRNVIALTYDGPPSATGGAANVHWVVSEADSTGYFRQRSAEWTVGAQRYFSQQIERGGSVDLRVPSGNLMPETAANGTVQVLDLRAGQPQPVPLPAPYSVAAMVGSDVLFATHDSKDGPTGLTLVPLSALPEPSAHHRC